MFFGHLCSHFNLCDYTLTSIDGACTLADVVITNPIHTIENSIHPIVLKITPSKKVGIKVATQVKDEIYYD
jgi:hypothetical protein